MPAIVWKGYLSFGLVSFPVSLSPAARPETVHFHMLHRKDKSRLKEIFYCISENKPVERRDIVKGFEEKKDHYVVVTDDELNNAAPPTATAMEILQFVKSAKVDPIYLEKSYYVRAGEDGGKPYALLEKAMMTAGLYAIAKVAMHGREHIVVIRPAENGLVLHTMYFADEIRKAEKSEKVAGGKVAAKEMELAKRLIEGLVAPFRPADYKDEYRENVRRLLAQKRKGQRVAAVEQPKVAPVIDIVDALRRSLAGRTAPAKRPRKNSRRAA